MDLISYAPALAEKPVLTLAAGEDALLPREDHIDRLNAAIKACGKEKLQSLCFADDHAFNTHRAEARAAVCGFFAGLL